MAISDGIGCSDWTSFEALLVRAVVIWGMKVVLTCVKLNQTLDC